ncbi:hypothetical protein GCM10009801_56440 [Streptomyces albiaxialis]|uniref:Uncharacterized protein n=1 Tax=Streptomyces albiaxialis TaxID=329523 RepID=A0ABN2WFZ3_9ACTN
MQVQRIQIRVATDPHQPASLYVELHGIGIVPVQNLGLQQIDLIQRSFGFPGQYLFAHYNGFAQRVEFLEIEGQRYQ